MPRLTASISIAGQQYVLRFDDKREYDQFFTLVARASRDLTLVTNESGISFYLRPIAVDTVGLAVSD